jgi:hypothetical protein
LHLGLDLGVHRAKATERIGTLQIAHALYGTEICGTMGISIMDQAPCFNYTGGLMFYSSTRIIVVNLE